ncbi:MAG TPA: hypothetical protein VKB78_00020 [Pirellulales bacterium]|nr:hypothetical protein [Pirellulales bacterium]
MIERFTDSRGALFAAVTRNRYGTLVLNSAGVMFLDWDAPRNSRQSLFNSIKKLFGRKTNPADDRFETETREKLARFRVENGEWTVRLYQTAGGLRGMVTHMLFDPAAASTLGTLKALGNDPLYIRLCESQSSFRARLTPKPWRCGAGKCTLAWPREGDTIVRFDRWVTRYDRRRAAFATCRFIDTIGPGAVHPEIAPIVELHDTLTRSSELLPLA